MSKRCTKRFVPKFTIIVTKEKTEDRKQKGCNYCDIEITCG